MSVAFVAYRFGEAIKELLLLLPDTNGRMTSLKGEVRKGKQKHKQ